MLTLSEHLDNLIRHIDAVRENCMRLGEKLISEGRRDFGRLLIAKGFVHDASKFYGIEWDYLHAGNDVSKTLLKKAVAQHVATNEHHPEYWGGIAEMPEIFIAEMVCDWYARSQEFGTDLRAWISKDAKKKFKIQKEEMEIIMGFVDKLIVNNFVKES